MEDRSAVVRFGERGEVYYKRIFRVTELFCISTAVVDTRLCKFVITQKKLYSPMSDFYCM